MNKQQSKTDYQLNRSWGHLRLLNYYRGFLALLFLTLFLNGWTELLIPEKYYNPVLFYWTTVVYTFLCITFMATIPRRKPGLAVQAAIQLCIDTLIMIAYIHASGGIRSGLGMLLIINVSASSLFLPRIQTLLFAAFTSLAILSQQLYSQYTILNYEPAYTQAGILGVLFFAFAFLTSNIYSKLSKSEEFASQQSLELETIVQMNEHIIQSMRTGIMVVSPLGKIYMSNQAATSLLGDIVISKNSTLEKTLPSLEKAFTHWKENASQPQTAIRQSHGLPDLQPGFSRIEPHKGDRSRVLIFLEDASQLNQRFQQVRLASLGRLTASIAHEIRNPLAAIHHAAQLLEESKLDASDKKLTNIINTQAERLNTLVENVLQLSRQQHGTPHGLDIARWLKQFKEEFVSTEGLTKSQIEIKMPDTINVLFDPDQLHQVMWNLCSNAVKHSTKPKKEVSICIEGGYTEEEKRPYIDIVDNGPGIATDIQEQIFDPFYTTNADGIGLGLYITKEVIESNRAKIHLIVKPNSGACFRIYFLEVPEEKTN